MIEIRNYTEEDEDSIIDICFETRDKSLRDLKDKRILALRWALCYTSYFSDYCFVATENEEVMGYILSTPDTLLQEKFHIEKIIPEIKARLTKEISDLNDFKAFIPINNMVPGLADKFPAHLHINLTSRCRQKGIGSRLMIAMENRLKESNISGLHLGVMKENEGAVNFYLKHGFTIYSEYDFGENNIGYFMVKKI